MKMTIFPMGPVLFVLFLGLKLAHIIDWNWWWVTAPVWGTFILLTILFTIAAVRQENKKRRLL